MAQQNRATLKSEWAEGQIINGIKTANLMDSFYNKSDEPLAAETHQHTISDVSGLSSALGNKLDASSYIQHFKGKYISLAALQTAFPTGVDGNYALVDAGSGNDAKQYIWDAQEGWVLSSGGAASSDATTLAGQAASYYLNRANHTGPVPTSGFIQVLTTAIAATWIVDCANYPITSLNPSGSALTAVSLVHTNLPNGGKLKIKYPKTTASNLTLSLPVGTLINDQNGNEVVGSSVILVGTAVSEFYMELDRIGDSYYLQIVRKKA